MNQCHKSLDACLTHAQHIREHIINSSCTEEFSDCSEYCLPGLTRREWSLWHRRCFMYFLITCRLWFCFLHQMLLQFPLAHFEQSTRECALTWINVSIACRFALAVKCTCLCGSIWIRQDWYSHIADVQSVTVVSQPKFLKNKSIDSCCDQAEEENALFVRGFCFTTRVYYRSDRQNSLFVNISKFTFFPTFSVFNIVKRRIFEVMVLNKL